MALQVAPTRTRTLAGAQARARALPLTRTPTITRTRTGPAPSATRRRDLDRPQYLPTRTTVTGAASCQARAPASGPASGQAVTPPSKCSIYVPAADSEQTTLHRAVHRGCKVSDMPCTCRAPSPGRTVHLLVHENMCVLVRLQLQLHVLQCLWTFRLCAQSTEDNHKVDSLVSEKKMPREF